MQNKWVTVTAGAALVVAVVATGTAVATTASASSNKASSDAQVAGLQRQTAQLRRQGNDLRQALATDVASFQKALDTEGRALSSVKSTANAAANANLGYCVTYSSVTYAAGYDPNGTNGQLLQYSLYYPSNITTPAVSGAGVVSCPSGTFVSVVPTKSAS